MALSIESTITLANGVEMPRLGFGTYKMYGPEARDSVRTALEVGYRSFDTASIYQNEAEVGQAIRESGVPREQIFVATKAWDDEQGEKEVAKAFERSLERLGLDYVDLYLVHWPVSRLYESTWRGMERLLADGRTRAIGVCNFLEEHLDALARVAEIMPMVDQIEYHPYLQQPGVRETLRERGIVLEAWSPIARGRVLDDVVLRKIAENHSVTTAQVTLRWIVQHDGVAIPKSATAERIRENADIYGFELSEGEMEAIDALDRGESGRFGTHPNEHG